MKGSRDTSRLQERPDEAAHRDEDGVAAFRPQEGLCVACRGDQWCDTGADQSATAITRKMRLSPASTARTTWEYSHRSRIRFQSFSPAASGASRFAGSKRMNPPLNPVRSCCLIQNLFTGWVKIQYAACIASSATNAKTVHRNAGLLDEVTSTRINVTAMPPPSPIPPPMKNPG